MARKIGISELEDALSEVVQAYIDSKDSYKDPVLVMGYDREGALEIEIYEAKRVRRPQDSVEYTLPELYVTDELRQEVPNYEVIAAIARNWCNRHA